ncbi:MAG: hypothetical protein H7A45_05195 [Verrucomicrobiales bacterium]|nr:hypothetical protein [Verrucomicrobiales bacterium]MCP5524868.1 hypothetical protein [Verrucomicrobiales bacterium]
MRRVLLDECCPSPLGRDLKGVKVLTVDALGWKGRKNGLLVQSAEGVCDVLITADQSLRYQQNLSGRRLAIIELPFNSWPLLRTMIDVIQAAVDAIGPGEYMRLSSP